jgi:hypothetical protein
VGRILSRKWDLNFGFRIGSIVQEVSGNQAQTDIGTYAQSEKMDLGCRIIKKV